MIKCTTIALFSHRTVRTDNLARLSVRTVRCENSAMVVHFIRTEANLKMVPVGGVPIPWSRLFAFAKV